jgi:hypothetical protein
MNGLITNAVTMFRVLYRIKPLILKFYDNRVLTSQEIDFLFHTEIVFHTYIKDLKKIVDLERRSELRIKKFSVKNGNSEELCDFEETIIEIMFLLFYLDGNCINSDNELAEEDKDSFGWLHALWMVYQVKKYIPEHLERKLGHLPKVYKNPELTHKPINDIYKYIMDLYVERRDLIFNKFESSNKAAAINRGVILAFYNPMISLTNESMQISNLPKMLIDLYTVILTNYPKVYDLIKRKRK